MPQALPQAPARLGIPESLEHACAVRSFRPTRVEISTQFRAVGHKVESQRGLEQWFGEL